MTDSNDTRDPIDSFITIDPDSQEPQDVEAAETGPTDVAPAIERFEENLDSKILLRILETLGRMSKSNVPGLKCVAQRLGGFLIAHGVAISPIEVAASSLAYSGPDAAISDDPRRPSYPNEPAGDARFKGPDSGDFPPKGWLHRLMLKSLEETGSYQTQFGLIERAFLDREDVAVLEEGIGPEDLVTIARVVIDPGNVCYTVYLTEDDEPNNPGGLGELLPASYPGLDSPIAIGDGTSDIIEYYPEEPLGGFPNDAFMIELDDGALMDPATYKTMTECEFDPIDQPELDELICTGELFFRSLSRVDKMDRNCHALEFNNPALFNGILAFIKTARLAYARASFNNPPSDRALRESAYDLIVMAMQLRTFVEPSTSTMIGPGGEVMICPADGVYTVESIPDWDDTVPTSPYGQPFYPDTDEDGYGEPDDDGTTIYYEPIDEDED